MLHPIQNIICKQQGFIQRPFSLHCPAVRDCDSKSKYLSSPQSPPHEPDPNLWKEGGNVRQGEEAHKEGSPRGENGELSQGQTQRPACETWGVKRAAVGAQQAKPTEEMEKKSGNGRTQQGGAPWLSPAGITVIHPHQDHCKHQRLSPAVARQRSRGDFCVVSLSQF